MTREAQMTPIDDAMPQRVATQQTVRRLCENETKLVLTDIAVYRSPVNCVIPPNHLVDKLDQVLGTHPKNVQDTANVPCWEKIR